MNYSIILVYFSLLSFFSSFLNPTFAETQAVSDYFPKSYEASKDRFVNEYIPLMKETYSKVETHSILVKKDENLTIDTLYIPAQKKSEKLVIITSGNHGPEGYAGSALQALFIEEVLKDKKLDLSHTGVLLVHALNPWGFKHHRRGTERNVNLNRNFDVSDKIFSTENQSYLDLRKFLELSGPVRNARSFPAKGLLVEMLTKKTVTQESLTEAIGKGQYSSSMGINYGGSKFEPQTQPIMEYLKKIVAPYASIFHIDLHTGLGKKQVLHVMTKKNMSDASLAAQKKILNASADQGMYEITPEETDGFYEILGDYADILRKIYPQKKVIVGITAEFGTVGNGLSGKVKTINRLILENEGYYYGYTNPKDEKLVKKRFLELFYPSSPEWRANLLTKGRYLLSVVVNRFVTDL